VVAEVVVVAMAVFVLVAAFVEVAVVVAACPYLAVTISPENKKQVRRLTKSAQTYVIITLS
jgi:hypothetical protein